MTDTAATTGNDVPENETANQKAARLRREKRNAKMAATGEERLAKIKGLNGGVAPPDEALGGPTVAPAAPKSATVDDPEEVDISDHPYTSKNVSQTGTPRESGPQQGDPLMQAMMQMQAQQAQQNQAQGGGEEDPMMKMMQQLMGMQPGQDPNDPNAMPQEIPQMAQMLSTMMGGGGMGGSQQQPVNSSAYLWRIVHALSALVIAVYITLTTTFSGSKLARTEDVFVQDAGYGLGSRPFFIFATTELILQTSRYFMEKGQLQGSGILATIANSGFVPEPWAQMIRTIGRYSTIYTTIVADAMVVIFVFGAVAWWKGLAAS